MRGCEWRAFFFLKGVLVVGSLVLFHPEAVQVEDSDVAVAVLHSLQEPGNCGARIVCQEGGG